MYKGIVNILGWYMFILAWVAVFSVYESPDFGVIDIIVFGSILISSSILIK